MLIIIAMAICLPLIAFVAKKRKKHIFPPQTHTFSLPKQYVYLSLGCSAAMSLFILAFLLISLLRGMALDALYPVLTFISGWALLVFLVYICFARYEVRLTPKALSFTPFIGKRICIPLNEVEQLILTPMEDLDVFAYGKKQIALGNSILPCREIAERTAHYHEQQAEYDTKIEDLFTSI